MPKMILNSPGLRKAVTSFASIGSPSPEGPEIVSLDHKRRCLVQIRRLKSD